MTLKPQLIRVAPQTLVPAVRVEAHSRLEGIKAALGLTTCRGAVAVVGGAAGFMKTEFDRVRDSVGVLVAELADVAHEAQVVVIDGGTDIGYMAILGQTCALRQHDFALVGVAPLKRITWHGRGRSLEEQLQQLLPWRDAAANSRPRRMSLEANHSAFVLVQAHNWGDEVYVLAQAARQLANGGPTVEVLINGGVIARRDVEVYLRENPQGQLVVVAGSGRFADELSHAHQNGGSRDELVQYVLESRRVHFFPLESPPGAFRQLLRQLAGW